MIHVNNKISYKDLEQRWKTLGANFELASSRIMGSQIPAPIGRWFCEIRTAYEPEEGKHLSKPQVPGATFAAVSLESTHYSLRAEIAYNFPIYFRNKGIMKNSQKEILNSVKENFKKLDMVVENGKYSEEDGEICVKNEDFTVFYSTGNNRYYFTVNTESKELNKKNINTNLNDLCKILELGFNVPYDIMQIGTQDIDIDLVLYETHRSPSSGFFSLSGIGGGEISIDDLPPEMAKLLGINKEQKKSSDLIAEVPHVSFDDLGGYESIKDEMQTIVYCIENPEILTEEGATLPRGVILFGPPGTGKSTMVKAVAHESGVPYIDVDASNLFSKWFGNTEKRIKEIFDLADETARKKGACIIGFDEMDALMYERYAGSSVGVSSLILKRMDGTLPLHEGVMLFGTTNRYDRIDPAFLRPGRFDRQLLMDRPDEAALKEIWKIHLKGKNIDKEIDYENLGVKSYKKEFTGADVFGTVKKAVLDRINSLRKKEIKKLEPMTTKYLLSVVDQIQIEKQKKSKFNGRPDLYS